MMLDGDVKKEEGPKEEFDENGLKIITLPVVGIKMKEKTYLLMMESFGVCMAIFSIITAVIAFNEIKAASNDVTSIVSNWELLPISEIVWVNAKADGSNPCATGYTMVPPMKTSGNGASCACAEGAKYYCTGKCSKSSETNKALSRGGACLTNQTTTTQKAAYKCVTVPANNLPGVTLSNWMGQVQCFKRGYTNAINTKSAEKGVCPAGTHQCGSADLPVCINDATSGCPVNWQSDSSAIAGYGVAAASLTTANLGVAPTTHTYDGQSPVPNVNPGHSVTHYTQKGKTYVSGKWTPLPVVEIGNSVGTPCYGEGKGDAGAGLTAVDGSQSQLGGTSIEGNTVIGSPEKCSQGTDVRFMATKNYGLGQLVFENAQSQGKTSCSATQTNTDYFASGNPKCSGTTGATGCAVAATGSFRTACSGNSCCKTGDKLCEYAAYQSKCGQWQNLATTNTQQASFYQKAQIYWSDTCPYTREEVVKSDGPLQKAINIQNTLLIINVIINVMLILLGAYIAYLCYKNWNEPTTTYATLEEVWKPRAVTLGTLVKMPVIIATIVVTKAITNFFVIIGDKNCAGTDAMGAVTNKTFTKLAEVLPAVVSANSATLAMDILGFLPVLYAYVKPYFCASDPNAGAATELEDGLKDVAMAPEPKVGGGADLRDLGGL